MCIEWLFFDVGNTLVDESKAYETRLREAAALIGKPYELIQEEALDFYRQNDKGDLAVMDKYGIPKPKWPKEDERLYPKPDPRIFEIALGRADCKAEHAVMIGDRIDNDVVPAKKMGMKTVWIRQGGGGLWLLQGPEQQPDFTVDNLGELVKIF